jgi:hypothetical protein
MKTIAESISAIQAAVSQYGFSAMVASSDLVIVRNSKNELVALVTTAGVEQKYRGAKNLCGSLVRNAITSAM